MRAIVIVCIVFAATSARAQVRFPPDPLFIALRCGDTAMSDLPDDDPAALDARDVVGNVTNPAGLRTGDEEFLYLRMRVDKTPEAPGGGALQPFSWGMAFDLDGNVQNYEVLVLVDAVTAGAPAVRLYANRTATPNDPRDPADLPEVASYPFDQNARLVTTGSKFGGDDDTFIDFAVPWADLRPLGMDRTTPVFVWVASSDSANALTGDFACHDGATGEPVLDVIVTEQTIGDPTIDSDGDGFTDAEEIENGSDPNDPNSIPPTRLEGGGGCSSGRGAGIGIALVVLAFRKRRRSRSG